MNQISTVPTLASKLIASGKIHGVSVRKILTHAHDRGNFREILRDDDHLLRRFGQASMTVTYPGVVKAFHYHRRQDDLWYFVSGNAQIVLHDLRKDSPTFGVTQELFAGDHAEPFLLLIPVGVAHGYRVLGNLPAVLLYFTTESYHIGDPDEERIAWDDPSIGFDWTTKNR